MKKIAILLCVFCGMACTALRAQEAGTQPAPKTLTAAEADTKDGLVVADFSKGASVDLLNELAAAESAQRKVLFQKLAKTGDKRLEAIFQLLQEGSLYQWQGHVVECANFDTRDGQKFAPLADPFTHKPLLMNHEKVVVAASELKEFTVSRRDRIFIRDALTVLRLSNPDRDDRLAAVVKAGEGAIISTLPALQDMVNDEKDPGVLTAVKESIALINLAQSGDDAQVKQTRLDAAKTLGEMTSGRALGRLKELRAKEQDASALAIYDAAIVRIEKWQKVVDWSGNIFSGLSASSILILMALGLSVVFGLMGVINMAHGELMMIGAYATYIVQQIFVNYLPPAYFDWYFVLAIPLAFLAAAAAGIVLEATVIRFLYGRPLETLLATWGVSLILIQIVRVIFGDNIAVNSPTWLRGSYEIVQDIRLPYNRIFIIGFCVVCIGLMYYIVERTRLGLLLRATTQNRQMAASLGVSTRKIDMLTFGLGAGLAGLAGCALTQIGGVTPDMGQNYVIDSFLVVVTGGVGKLAGAIWTGLGLGMINKLLEPLVATVWAKVLILLLVVAFLQRKPSGLFPAKGRLADV